MIESEFAIRYDDFVEAVEEVEINKSQKRGINKEKWKKTKLKEEKRSKRNKG